MKRLSCSILVPLVLVACVDIHEEFASRAVRDQGLLQPWIGRHVDDLAASLARPPVASYSGGNIVRVLVFTYERDGGTFFAFYDPDSGRIWKFMWFYRARLGAASRIYACGELPASLWRKK